MRVCALLGCVMVFASPASAWGWTSDFAFCSSPLRPQCIDARETYRTSRSTKACEEEVRRYEDSTIAYRACMFRETQRAVLELNDSLTLFKCRSTARQHCS